MQHCFKPLVPYAKRSGSSFHANIAINILYQSSPLSSRRSLSSQSDSCFVSTASALDFSLIWHWMLEKKHLWLLFFYGRTVKSDCHICLISFFFSPACRQISVRIVKHLTKISNHISCVAGWRFTLSELICHARPVVCHQSHSIIYGAMLTGHILTSQSSPVVQINVTHNS